MSTKQIFNFVFQIWIRGYHFLPNGGGMKKLGVTEFFHEKQGGHKKNQEIIGWLQILMKIFSMK